MRSGCSLCSGGSKESFQHMHAVHTKYTPLKQNIKMMLTGDTSDGGSIISTIMYYALFALAAYLSWSCNTKEGVEVLLKVLYAFFAGVFNIFYLIYYFIVKRGTC